MKKIITILLSALFVMTILGGCSKNQKKEINGPDDLDGAKIGVQLGTTGDIYVSDDYDSNVERYNKGFEAVQALLQDKIDAVVIDDQPAKVFVEQNDGLKILDTEFAVEEYAICVAKENEELLEQINKAIAELQKNGTIDAIVDYYINESDDAVRYESPADVVYDGEFIMATNAEFPPYEMHEGDDIIGLDVDLATAIGDLIGKKLVISDMQFDSIVMAVKSGKADFGAAGLTVTEDRLEEINFTDSYYTGRQVIIVKE